MWRETEPMGLWVWGWDMRRGRKKLEEQDRRVVVVKACLSPGEAVILDARRNRLTRGAFLRAAAIDSIPQIIPPVNASLHADLGRALGNLATISTAMRGGDFIEVDECREAVRRVRNLLISVPEFSHCGDELE